MLFVEISVEIELMYMDGCRVFLLSKFSNLVKKLTFGFYQNVTEINHADLNMTRCSVEMSFPPCHIFHILGLLVSLDNSCVVK